MRAAALARVNRVEPAFSSFSLVRARREAARAYLFHVSMACFAVRGLHVLVQQHHDETYWVGVVTKLTTGMFVYVRISTEERKSFKLKICREVRC